MDNKIAQEILSAYRPGGEDARDPNFQDALEQCNQDPDMKDWLRRERERDQRVSAALENIDVPSQGKVRLLQMLPKIETPPSGDNVQGGGRSTHSILRGRLLPSLIGIAALFLGALLIWQAAFQYEIPPLEQSSFSMGKLISNSMPLSFHDRNPEVVMTWLSAQNAPLSKEFPSGLANAAAMGCRIFEVPGAGKISLICLLLNGELVHYFVFDEQAKELLAYAPLDTWWTEEGWHMYSYSDGTQRVALATQGQTSNLL